MPWTRSARLLCAALPVLLAGGCSTQVRDTGNYLSPASAGTTSLPRPVLVVVEDFTDNPAAVRLDSGISARLQREFQGADDAQGQAAAARQVQDAIAKTLVADLRKMGFDAERAPGGTASGPMLVVRGEIADINEGNRTRRNVVGFGAGKSDVRADVQLLYATPAAAPVLIQTYTADSNSGRKPGLGAGAAAGHAETAAAVAGVGVLSSATHQTGVAGEGERMAHRLASDFGNLFVRQGWISPSAVPAVSLR
jgi:Domain of unknown function (DUF4410)